jgi:hypothetical protein
VLITVRQGTLIDLAEWIRIRALLWPESSVRDHRLDTERILKNSAEETAHAGLGFEEVEQVVRFRKLLSLK